MVCPRPHIPAKRSERDQKTTTGLPTMHERDCLGDFRKVKVHTFHRFFRHCSLNIKFELYLVLEIRTRTGDLGGSRYLELNMFHYEEIVDFEIFSLKRAWPKAPHAFDELPCYLNYAHACYTS